jgi:hypothetical protein
MANNEEQLSILPRFYSLVENRATLPVFIRDALDEAVLGNSGRARFYYSRSNNVIEIFEQCLLNDIYIILKYMR